MAFSISSASRCTTSATAPPSSRPWIGRHGLHPGVALDLADRGPDDGGERDGLAPLTAGHLAAEHGDVLDVAPDPGGDVVDLEQAAQQVGVLHLLLQLVQDLDALVDERLEPGGPG